VVVKKIVTLEVFGSKWTRMENEWEIGKKVKILSFFVRKIYKSATILKKKHTTVKG